MIYMTATRLHILYMHGQPCVVNHALEAELWQTLTRLVGSGQYRRLHASANSAQSRGWQPLLEGLLVAHAHRTHVQAALLQ